MHSTAAPSTPQGYPSGQGPIPSRPAVATASPTLSGFDRSSVTLALVTLSAGVLALLGISWALSRPCVLGECQRLLTVEANNRELLNELTESPSTETLVSAHEQLQGAEEQLQGIPPWSRYHRRSRELSESLQRRSQQLQAVRSPLGLAYQASLLSQNPPHRLEEWQRMEALWIEAIAQLEAIDPENPAYTLARGKLREYRQNLAAVQQRAILERRGAEQIEAAQLAAEMARTQESQARDVETWERAYSSWRTAITALMRVPAQTTAQRDARELFQSYGPHLSSAEQRHRREQVARRLHEQAVTLADEARIAQDAQEWDGAITKWRQAIGYAQQIPENTAYSDQSRPLLQAYTNALIQAIASQEISEAMSRAQGDLRRLCQGSPQICEYQVTRDRLQVKLLPDYVSRIQNLHRQANQQNNEAAKQQIDQHVRRLIDGLELVSLNTEIRLTVLNPEGEEIARFSGS
ncbi:hypothetical protein NEA10_03000 [Phormidium yuhuli AB48]|uniref:Uncharacterized protein n=1 Tax=Phormidium yuhuli AB48 TaxID=2940671 RepID=A0ABY5AR56_9CYAN|nr:hypothetical protein [Phormidium yuhuli]USR91712.1 hypothetical protein NEA10_03000 [Phormidium yuhuli AB48]